MPKTAIIIAHLALKTAVLIAHEVSPVVGPGVDVCPGVAQEWMSAQEVAQWIWSASRTGRQGG